MNRTFTAILLGFLLWPGSSQAGPEFRGWLKLFGGGALIPDLPMAGAGRGDGSELAMTSAADLRIEVRHSFGDTGHIDLALMSRGNWLDMPAHLEAFGGSALFSGGDSSVPGRLVEASIRKENGDYSFFGEVDRLAGTLWWRDVELVLGRQAITWGRTLVFQPIDVLAPFSLLSYDTEAKPGIDALRVRVPIPLEGTLDLVANLDKDSEGSAYAGRATLIIGPAEIGVMGGHLRGEWVSGLDGVWSFEKWSLRGELLVLPERDNVEGLVGAIGFDRFFLGGDLQAFAEFMHDGRGASSPDELPGIFLSADFQEGRMKLPAMDSGAIGIRHQVAALWSLNLSVVSDLRDWSGLAMAQLTRSLSDNLAADLILYRPWGEGWIREGNLPQPGSSFGTFPSVAAIYLRAYR